MLTRVSAPAQSQYDCTHQRLAVGSTSASASPGHRAQQRDATGVRPWLQVAPAPTAVPCAALRTVGATSQSSLGTVIARQLHCAGVQLSSGGVREGLAPGLADCQAAAGINLMLN